MASWLLSFLLTLLSFTFISGTFPDFPSRSIKEFLAVNSIDGHPKMHTIFSVECGNYFDWQAVGIMHSYRKSGQPGPITRLLSCTDADLKTYKNMDLAPTHVVPSWTHHPLSGDWYAAINKPKGVVDWLENSAESRDVEWVVILDADMIIRGPVTPWELNAEKGKPVAAYYGYLIGCDNILAQLHTKNPHLCDKVGGFIVMHISDLRRFAPLWLSKTEEVRADKAHYATNITGDIYGQGWISEMYGYSFGAAECELRHKIDDNLMLYPGYEPMANQDPRLLHYGLPFEVLRWHFGKSDHGSDAIVDDCNRLFEQPPYPNQVEEKQDGKRRRDLLSIECINTINEGLLIHHSRHGCPEPSKSPYVDFLMANIREAARKVLRSRRGTDPSGTIAALEAAKSIASLAELFLDSTPSGLSEWRLKTLNSSESKSTPEKSTLEKLTSEKASDKKSTTEDSSAEKSTPGESTAGRSKLGEAKEAAAKGQKIVTLFSVECSNYFDWQTLGLMYSFKRSGQPGSITRLLSCTEEELSTYRGRDIAPSFLVPSWSQHPKTKEWYPAINKPVGVNFWLQNSPEAKEAEWVIILDADMILRKPLLPSELGAEIGKPVSASYNYLIGCDNILGRLHMKDPSTCDKVGGFIVMHISDLRRFAPLWLSKTEEVRADKAHYATNITGDVYGQGWISEMYGYSFGASDAGLKHKITTGVMLYPGYLPDEGLDPILLHYGLPMNIGDWEFNKAKWRKADLVYQCSNAFPDPPHPRELNSSLHPEVIRRDLIVIECVGVLNRALREYHRDVLHCPDLDEVDQVDIDLGLASKKPSVDDGGSSGDDSAAKDPKREETVAMDSVEEESEESAAVDLLKEELAAKDQEEEETAAVDSVKEESAAKDSEKEEPVAIDSVKEESEETAAVDSLKEESAAKDPEKEEPVAMDSLKEESTVKESGSSEGKAAEDLVTDESQVQNDETDIGEDTSLEEAAEKDLASEKGVDDEADDGYSSDESADELARKLEENSLDRWIMFVGPLEIFLSSHPRLWMVIPWALFLVIIFILLSNGRRSRAQKAAAPLNVKPKNHWWTLKLGLVPKLEVDTKDTKV